MTNRDHHEDQAEFDMGPSSLDLVTSWLRQPVRQSDSYVGISFPVNSRLQARQYSMLEAMTKQADISRNKMLNHLLEVGIDTVLKSLPEAAADTLESQSGQILMNALAEKENRK